MSTSEDSMTKHLGEFSTTKFPNGPSLSIVRAIVNANVHDFP
jgi:hypothetical protein